MNTLAILQRYSCIICLTHQVITRIQIKIYLSKLISFRILSYIRYERNISHERFDYQLLMPYPSFHPDFLILYKLPARIVLDLNIPLLSGFFFHKIIIFNLENDSSSGYSVWICWHFLFYKRPFLGPEYFLFVVGNFRRHKYMIILLGFSFGGNLVQC